MNLSKPGRKLNPIITEQASAIYGRDRDRYKNLIRWIWWQQKRGYSDEAIAKTLELAGENVHKASDWWKYLTALINKGHTRAVESESEEHKQGGLESFAHILKRIMG